MSALGMGGQPGGFPPSIQIGGGGPADSDNGASEKPDGDWEQDLQQALAALRQSAADAPDHTEAQVIDKCVAAIQGLLAARQKGAESAMGITPAHKALKRAY